VSQPERAEREVRGAMPAARTFSRSLESLTIGAGNPNP
jgi:hypothetical protein